MILAKLNMCERCEKYDRMGAVAVCGCSENLPLAVEVFKHSHKIRDRAPSELRNIATLYAASAKHIGAHPNFIF